VLAAMELGDTPELLVFNQIDRLPPGEGQDLAAREGGIAISALQALGLRELLEAVEKRLWSEDVDERSRLRLASLGA
jgi:50S ribosomal subunit-associated GTPase HflX